MEQYVTDGNRDAAPPPSSNEGGKRRHALKRKRRREKKRAAAASIAAASTPDLSIASDSTKKDTNTAPGVDDGEKKAFAQTSESTARAQNDVATTVAVDPLNSDVMSRQYTANYRKPNLRLIYQQQEFAAKAAKETNLDRQLDYPTQKALEPVGRLAVPAKTDPVNKPEDGEDRKASKKGFPSENKNIPQADGHGEHNSLEPQKKTKIAIEIPYLRPSLGRSTKPPISAGDNAEGGRPAKSHRRATSMLYSSGLEQESGPTVKDTHAAVEQAPKPFEYPPTSIATKDRAEKEGKKRYGSGTPDLGCGNKKPRLEVKLHSKQEETRPVAKTPPPEPVSIREETSGRRQAKHTPKVCVDAAGSPILRRATLRNTELFSSAANRKTRHEEGHDLGLASTHHINSGPQTPQNNNGTASSSGIHNYLHSSPLTFTDTTIADTPIITRSITRLRAARTHTPNRCIACKTLQKDCQTVDPSLCHLVKASFRVKRSAKKLGLCSRQLETSVGMYARFSISNSVESAGVRDAEEYATRSTAHVLGELEKMNLHILREVEGLKRKFGLNTRV